MNNLFLLLISCLNHYFMDDLETALKDHKFYEPSEKYSRLSFIWLAFSLGLVVPLLAYTYAWLLLNIPYDLINLGVFLGVIYVIKQIIKYVIIWGKVRNTIYCFFIGWLISFVFYYLQWVSWSNLSFKILALTDFRFSPVFVWKYIMLVGKGAWLYSPFHGYYLFGSWLAELIGFMYVSFTYWASLFEKPFSEEKNKWHKQISSPPLELIDPEKLLQAIHKLDVDYLESIPVTTISRKDFSQLILFTAEGNEDYLSLILLELRKTDFGEIEHDKYYVFENLQICPEHTKRLLKAFKQKPVPPKKKKIYNLELEKPIIEIMYEETFAFSNNQLQDYSMRFSNHQLVINRKLLDSSKDIIIPLECIKEVVSFYPTFTIILKDCEVDNKDYLKLSLKDIEIPSFKLINLFNSFIDKPENERILGLQAWLEKNYSYKAYRRMVRMKPPI